MRSVLSEERHCSEKENHERTKTDPEQLHAAPTNLTIGKPCSEPIAVADQRTRTTIR